MAKNKKQVIRLRESDLHRIIKESVNKILRESDEDMVAQDIQNWQEWYDNLSDEEFAEEFGMAIDRKGKQIHKGDIVIWIDPETGSKSRYRVWDRPTEEMVKLTSKYGECEALPEECIVVK